jgi:hypothetical protein
MPREIEGNRHFCNLVFDDGPKKIDMISPIQHWISCDLVVKSVKYMVNKPVECIGPLGSGAVKFGRNEVIP